MRFPLKFLALLRHFFDQACETGGCPKLSRRGELRHRGVFKYLLSQAMVVAQNEWVILPIRMSFFRTIPFREHPRKNYRYRIEPLEVSAAGDLPDRLGAGTLERLGS